MSMFRKAIEEAEKAAQQVGQKIQDPATKDQARRFAGRARRGLTTIVERIDPGLLADVVIKATSIQEKANAALRTKRSPYRIGEVVISAAIPPQVSFAIVRIDDVEEEISGDVRESSELVQPVAGEEGAVLALDGSAPPGDEIGEPGEGGT
jgi:hypothetical protein